ncbi:hypothetical protein [Rhizobium sp. F40D2]
MMIFFMVWSPGWWHQNFKSAKLFPARSAIVRRSLALSNANGMPAVGRLHEETTMARRCFGETLRPCAEA